MLCRLFSVSCFRHLCPAVYASCDSAHGPVSVTLVLVSTCALCMFAFAARRVRIASARGCRRRCTKPESEEGLDELKERMVNAVRLPLLPGAVLGAASGALMPNDMPLAQQLGLAAAAGAVGSILGICAGIVYADRVLGCTGSAAGIQHFLVGSVTATGAVVCRNAISDPVCAPLDEMQHARTRQLEVRVDRLEARLEQQEAELAELRRAVN